MSEPSSSLNALDLAEEVSFSESASSKIDISTSDLETLTTLLYHYKAEINKT